MGDQVQPKLAPIHSIEMVRPYTNCNVGGSGQGNGAFICREGAPPAMERGIFVIRSGESLTISCFPTLLRRIASGVSVDPLPGRLANWGKSPHAI